MSGRRRARNTGNLLNFSNKMSNFWMFHCVKSLQSSERKKQRKDTNMGTIGIKWKMEGMRNREDSWKEVCEGSRVGLGVFRNVLATAPVCVDTLLILVLLAACVQPYWLDWVGRVKKWGGLTHVLLCGNTLIRPEKKPDLVTAFLRSP